MSDQRSDFLKSVERLKNEQAERARQLKVAERAVRRETIEAARELLELDKTALMWLYWDTDLSPSWVMEASDLTAPEFKRLREANPRVLQTCAACGNRRTVASRQEQVEEERYTTHVWKWDICPSCWPKCNECQCVLSGYEHELHVLRDSASKSVRCQGCAEKEIKQEAQETQERTRKEKYGEYLRSDHWRSTRQWALERAEGKCQACSSTTDLHVHHRTYDRIGAELPADLIVLCSDCHAVFHEHRDLVR